MAGKLSSLIFQPTVIILLKKIGLEDRRDPVPPHDSTKRSLGVNLLSREGNSQTGQRTNCGWNPVWLEGS